MRQKRNENNDKQKRNKCDKNILRKTSIDNGGDKNRSDKERRGQIIIIAQ